MLRPYSPASPKPFALAALLSLVGALVVTEVRAETSDPVVRTAARELGYAGVEAYQKGDYGTAHDKLERAYRLMPVPTLALWSARTLVKLGRWVEASERYLEAGRLKVSSEDTGVQQRAQQEALNERTVLLPRIPSVRIVIEGAPPDQAKVFVDGKRWPAPLVGVDTPIDPGGHRVAAVFGDQRQEERVDVPEGSSHKIVLVFAPRSAAPRLPPPTPSEPSEPANVPMLVAFGTGAAGLAVGLVAGVIALDKRSQLQNVCPAGQCEPVYHDDVDAYDRWRTASTAGVSVGVVGVAVGIVLYVTDKNAPKAETAVLAPARRRAFEPFVTVQEARAHWGIAGTF